MKSRHRPWIQAPAASLVAVLSVLSGAVPALDCDLYFDGEVIHDAEQPFHPGRPHDHSICIQVGASLWSPAPPVALPRPVAQLPHSPPREFTAHAGVHPLALPHPRAPPSA